MKFIDEVDIELVNQELNFHSTDNNVVIKGGCDLFTTKPIASDRKLFKTIDKHLNQIIEDNQLSQSLGRERHYSMGSSASPPSGHLQFRQQLNQYMQQQQQQQPSQQPLQQPSPRQSPQQQYSTINNRRASTNLINEQGNSDSSKLSDSNSAETSFDNSIAVDESPFGPLKSNSTRKTFAYLIAILNTTYPDHDFSNLQPTEENFHRINSSEDLIHRFNNIMLSLGKKEDLLNWIWDTINVYMDLVPTKSPILAAHDFKSKNKDQENNSHHHHHRRNSNNHRPQPVHSNSNTFEGCQVYEFQPSDQSILEDLNYPYQTLWSYYWFIYNKKKKRVSFLYLTAINKMHFSMINRNRGPSFSRQEREKYGSNLNEDDDTDVHFEEEDDIYNKINNELI
ncbi:repressor of RNA polymerase III transcription MAF1 [Hyphopichia burtonii NRRL Y-1933]|uniref:Repressor of RNA polymerase III transcription MAF1 n=1 Tax=Hyphopichia burtonii NRRL Y-1933 TaxID=984485 RepID=A0A1E4RKH7_9ASCO|nr:repressor of RNA polymerase III transcription MAF1 [Hyphopichia burtonii NRRL Y-1933]ODV67711.1 repressor of RNA polymerase III transcription MAF1 [Hyphopichia burtonii NRRL Y-1933]